MVCFSLNSTHLNSLEIVPNGQFVTQQDNMTRQIKRFDITYGNTDRINGLFEQRDI